MTTNTFSSVREPIFRPRLKTSYTQTLPMFQGKRWFCGAGTITGWIRNGGSVPQQRRACLYVWPHMTLIAVNLSDPDNVGNNYFFNGLQDISVGYGETYVVSVHDVAQVSAAAIIDNLTPI